MSRVESKLSGMTIVRCDWAYDKRYPGEAKGCVEEFRSASIKQVIPVQLENAGWVTRRAPEGPLQHFCPMHAERIGLVRKLPEKRTW